MNPIEWLAKRAYALPNSRLSGLYDKAVIIDYASEIRDGEVWLPSAEILSLTQAALLYNLDTIKDLAWANTQGQKYAPKTQAENEKIAFLKANIPSFEAPRRELGCTNTITEAEAIIKACPALRWGRIILIGDWRHIPRTVAIWKKLLPYAEIAHISVDGQWTGEHHPSSFVRWNAPFLLMNVVYHGLMKGSGTVGFSLLRGLKQAKE